MAACRRAVVRTAVTAFGSAPASRSSRTTGAAPTRAARHDERCAAVGGPMVDVGSGADQLSADRFAVQPHEQRRGAPVGRDIRVGSGRDDPAHRVGVGIERRVHQRGPTTGLADARGRLSSAARQLAPEGLRVALAQGTHHASRRRDDSGGGTRASVFVGPVGTLIQPVLDDLDLAAVQRARRRHLLTELAAKQLQVQPAARARARGDHGEGAPPASRPRAGPTGSRSSAAMGHDSSRSARRRLVGRRARNPHARLPGQRRAPQGAPRGTATGEAANLSSPWQYRASHECSQQDRDERRHRQRDHRQFARDRLALRPWPLA